MLKDHYKINVLGKLAPGFDRNASIDKLATVFKVSRIKFERLLDGRKRTIKGNLSLPHAQKYQKVLEGAGVVCEIDVVLNKAIFESAVFFLPELKPYHTDIIKRKNHVVADKNKREADRRPRRKGEVLALYCTFNGYNLNPPIFSPPADIPLLNADGHSLGLLKTEKCAFGWALIVMATILTSFVLEHTVLTFMLKLVGPSSLTRISAVLIFFICLLFFPKWLVPQKEVLIETFLEGEKSIQYTCRSTKTGTALIKKFKVYNEKGRETARIQRSLLFSQSKCTTMNNDLVFQAMPGTDIDETARSVGGDTLQGLYSFLSTISLIFSNVSFFKELSERNRKKNKKSEWTLEITDAGGATVATLEFQKTVLKNRKTFILNIDQEKSDTVDIPLLLAFIPALSGA